MNIKKFLTTSVIAVAMSVTSIGAAYAQSQNITIASGMEGGGYHSYAVKMAERLNQRGYRDVTVVPTNGSDAITLAACNGNADIWISQVDAIYTRHKEGCVLQPVADYGTEVAVILFPPKSKLDQLSDLNESHRVAVDGIGSGTELFWKTIVSIELGDNGNKNKWARATTVESSPELLNTMANYGDIHAAILVRRPTSDHIKMLLDQGWTVGELWDRDINREVFNSLPLYESKKVAFTNSNNRKQTNYVYEVRSFIGVSPKFASDRKFRMDVAGSTN